MFQILILEDDRELNQTITYALEKEGYHVFSAFSCKEAEHMAEDHAFQLAILDVNPAGWRRSSVLRLAEGEKAGSGFVSLGQRSGRGCSDRI